MGRPSREHLEDTAAARWSCRARRRRRRNPEGDRRNLTRGWDLYLHQQRNTLVQNKYRITWAAGLRSRRYGRSAWPCKCRCDGLDQHVYPSRAPDDIDYSSSAGIAWSCGRPPLARGKAGSTTPDRVPLAPASTNTGHSRRRHGLCSMLLLPAVSGSLNRLAFHAPLLLEPRR